MEVSLKTILSLITAILPFFVLSCAQPELDDAKIRKMIQEEVAKIELPAGPPGPPGELSEAQAAQIREALTYTLDTALEASENHQHYNIEDAVEDLEDQLEDEVKRLRWDLSDLSEEIYDLCSDFDDLRFQRELCLRLDD